MKYRKKPVVIDAIQYDGFNVQTIKAFTDGDAVYRQGVLIIKTLEGEHIASEGDYIIRGIKGEHYPCKPDIFAATYEAAE